MLLRNQFACFEAILVDVASGTTNDDNRGRACLRYYVKLNHARINWELSIHQDLRVYRFFCLFIFLSLLFINSILVLFVHKDNF